MEQVYAFYMVCGSAFDSMVDGVVFRRNFIRLAIASDLKLAQFQSRLATIQTQKIPQIGGIFCAWDFTKALLCASV